MFCAKKKRFFGQRVSDTEALFENDLKMKRALHPRADRQSRAFVNEDQVFIFVSTPAHASESGGDE